MSMTCWELGNEKFQGADERAQTARWIWLDETTDVRPLWETMRENTPVVGSRSR